MLVFKIQVFKDWMLKLQETWTLYDINHDHNWVRFVE